MWALSSPKDTLTALTVSRPTILALMTSILTVELRRFCAGFASSVSGLRISRMLKLLVYAVVIFCSLLGAVGQLFFKLGSSKITGLNLDNLLNFPLAVGLFLYGISTVLFILMLKQGELSLLYPLIAFSYVFVGLISFFYLKEPVSLINFFGFAVIIVGVALSVYR